MFLEAAGKSLATEPIAATVGDPSTIENTMRQLGREAGGGLVVAPDTFTVVHRDLIISLAARYLIPAVYAFRFFVTAAGLLPHDR